VKKAAPHEVNRGVGHHATVGGEGIGRTELQYGQGSAELRGERAVTSRD